MFTYYFTDISNYRLLLRLNHHYDIDNSTTTSASTQTRGEDMDTAEEGEVREQGSRHMLDGDMESCCDEKEDEFGPEDDGEIEYIDSLGYGEM